MEDRQTSLADTYDELRKCKAYERRTLLSSLQDQLHASVLSLAVLNAGLDHPSNDVKRCVLEHLSHRLDSNRSSVPCSFECLLKLLLSVLRHYSDHKHVSSIRTKASCLRAVSSLLQTESAAKISSFDAHFLMQCCLVTAATGIMTLQSRTSTLESARRKPPGITLAFGTTTKPSSQNNWRLSSTHRREDPAKCTDTRSLKRQNSTSSLGSTLSDASIGGESDSDVESVYENRNHTAAQRIARQRAILCLDMLNKHSPKMLLVHWPSVLCESEGGTASMMDIADIDPATSNRVAACHTTESFFKLGAQHGFFSGAEERNRTTAYTSLSSRIASTVVHVRTRLSHILSQIPSGGVPLQVSEAVIRCARTLVESTRIVKLRQKHADVLQPIALQLCSSKEPRVAITAYTLLSAMAIGRNVDVCGSLPGTILPTLRESPSVSVQVDAWNAIAGSYTAGQLLSLEDEQELDKIAMRDMETQSQESVRLSIANYYLARVRYDKAKAQPELHNLLCLDEAPAVRTLAADALGYAPSSLEWIRRATKDPESSVRSAAIRSVGVLVQNTKSLVLLDCVLLCLKDPALLVRMRASWSLGNACEAQGTVALLSACVGLKKDDDKIAVHGVRGVGALLATCPMGDLIDHDESVCSGLKWLVTLLTYAKDPKLRWNTCASLGRALGATQERTAWLLDQCKKHVFHVLDALICVLQTDKVFKTRLAACTALTGCLEFDGALDLLLETGQPRSVQLCNLQQAVQMSQEKLAEQSEQASFREAQLHVVPLQRALQTLATHFSHNMQAQTFHSAP